MNEIWFDMEKYEGLYKYSNLLRIKSIGRTIIRCDGVKKTIKERILPVSMSSAYARVFVNKNGKCEHIQLHKFFAIRFIPNPENKKYINHKNGDKYDYSLSNLEWATKSEDNFHAFRTGLRKPVKGEKSNFWGNKYLQHKTGGNNIRAKMVLDLQTGIYYDCIKDAAMAKCINYGSLVASLANKIKNKTQLIYA